MSEKNIYENLPWGWYVPGMVDPEMVPQPGPVERQVLAGTGTDLSREQLQAALLAGLRHWAPERAQEEQPLKTHTSEPTEVAL